MKEFKKLKTFCRWFAVQRTRFEENKATIFLKGAQIYFIYSNMFFDKGTRVSTV